MGFCCSPPRSAMHAATFSPFNSMHGTASEHSESRRLETNGAQQADRQPVRPVFFAPCLRRGWSAFQAIAHKLLALVAFEFLVAGVFVARLHFVLLRFLLLGCAGVFTL